jgi:hypothetical protein
MNDKAEPVFLSAMQALGHDYSKIQERLEATKGNATHTFILKFLEWLQDKYKHQLLWEMFHETLSLNPLTVLGELDSFVGNCILDDSYFKVEWRKIDYGTGYDVQWLPDGKFKMKVCRSDDPAAKPVVLRAGDDGCQDPNVLIETMQLFEKYDAARTAMIEEEFSDGFTEEHNE